MTSTNELIATLKRALQAIPTINLVYLCGATGSFNPKLALQAIPTVVVDRFLKEKPLFQSQTGSTGHSDEMDWDVGQRYVVKFQSQTGSTGHSDMRREAGEQIEEIRFNPKRAPQAI
jgi:hypothetical protein